MFTFNREQYLDEMQALIAQAKENIRAKAPGAVIFTLNVWTDPEAAASAVNLDTEESSARMIAFQNQRMAARRGRLLAAGDTEEAALWPDQEGRICNPADFAYSMVAECDHHSFSAGWEEASGGECWDILEPVLLEVGELARVKFADLPLHPEAELSVNSRDDWYNHTWAMG